jgi:DNA-binding NarL/FixJ family response regulator
MEQSLRILIADDDRHARAGLRALLTASLACEIVGEAADGEDVVAQVAHYRPDAVVLDLRMPVLDGMQATRIIKERWPAIIVVALTMYIAHRDAALAAGADAFVSKGDTPTRVIQVLRALAHSAAVQTPPRPDEPGPW